jgi:hypothetical protein
MRADGSFGLVQSSLEAFFLLAVESRQLLFGRLLNAFGCGQLPQVLLVSLARVAPHQALHRRVGLQGCRIDAYTLAIGQPMFAQNLQHPFHHRAMRVDCIQPPRARHRRMIRRQLAQIVAQELAEAQ